MRKIAAHFFSDRNMGQRFSRSDVIMRELFSRFDVVQITNDVLSVDFQNGRFQFSGKDITNYLPESIRAAQNFNLVITKDSKVFINDEDVTAACYPFRGKVDTRLPLISNLSPEEIEYYTQTRLLPKSNAPQAYWGCSSRTGFLAPDDNLLEVVQRDKVTLETSGISFEQIADALEGLIKTAHVEPEKRVNGLQVTVSRPTVCFQYCPLSPPGADDECGPFNEPKDACGKSNMDVTIINTQTGEQLSFSALLPHLIRDHHFFEGSVPHRLAPEQIIRVLGLTQGNIDKFINQATVVTPPSLFGKPSVVAAAVPKMPFVGSSPILDWLSASIVERYTEKFYDSDGSIEARLLPYKFGMDSAFKPEETDLQNGDLFLHFFNVGKNAAVIDDIFQGMKVNLTIPPMKRIIFGPIPRASLQPDEGKRIIILDPTETPRSQPRV